MLHQNSNPSGRIRQTFYNRRNEEKKERLDKYVFPSVCVCVSHEEPGNYTHLIPFPRNYSYLPNLALTLQILEVVMVFINAPYNKNHNQLRPSSTIV